MSWETLQDPAIKSFIFENEASDIRALALKKPPQNSWPYALIIDQIKARQKAKTKMPSWYARKDVTFPSSDIIEQASSEACAKYKASLFKGDSFVDLTGGAGIDAWALSQSFKSGTVIERTYESFECLKHNLDLEIHHMRAEDYIRDMLQTDLVFIDPQRRDSQTRGLFRFEDCNPNIHELLPILKDKTKHILIKTSPILDIKQATQEIESIQEIHVVEYEGDCKELLLLINTQIDSEATRIRVSAIDSTGTPTRQHSFTLDEERNASLLTSPPLNYLFEPSPAFQKSGGYKTLSVAFDAPTLAQHTHLYTANEDRPDFPGRRFKLLGQYPVQAKALPKGLNKANLTIRNFPMDINTLKKKLKITDGGEDYLFACTLEDETHILLHGQRI